MPLFDRKDKDSLTINLLNAIGEWHKKYRESVAELGWEKPRLSHEAEEVLQWAGHLRGAIGADGYRKIHKADLLVAGENQPNLEGKQFWED